MTPFFNSINFLSTDVSDYEKQTVFSFRPMWTPKGPFSQIGSFSAALHCTAIQLPI